jgi:hypothetical protein
MWQLLASETEVLIHAGFVYLPLLFDPPIKAELDNLTGPAAPPPPGVVQALTENLMSAAGGYFVKSLSLSSLVDNYPAVFPEEYQQERRRFQSQVFPEAPACRPLLDGRLQAILFDILPHFLHSRQGCRRRRVGAASVLASLSARLPNPPARTNGAARLQERESSLRQVLQRLEHLPGLPEPLQGYHRHGRGLAGWFRQALQANLVTREISHWQRELAQVQALLNLPGPHLAVLLAIASRGALEVDGFGCFPDKKYPGQYLVYKRTGEFVLQDYFGRLYLFPDCRVGVPTAGPYDPLVLDKYKHPLLRRFASRQQICLSDYQAAPHFSAAGVINALEQGLNALFYGYNSRKRNGYNSLDTFGRHQSVVDFEDWRLPPDDPRVVTGAVEVKNSTF